MLGGIELVKASGELAGKRFRIGDKPLKLGRASSNDIGIAGDERLSRIHCLFEPDGSGGNQRSPLPAILKVRRSFCILFLPTRSS